MAFIYCTNRNVLQWETSKTAKNLILIVLINTNINSVTFLIAFVNLNYTVVHWAVKSLELITMTNNVVCLYMQHFVYCASTLLLLDVIDKNVPVSAWIGVWES